MQEAHLFADLALSRRLERAEAHANARFVEARADVFPRSGAQWIEVAGAYALFDGVASPLTQTFGLGLFERVTDTEMEAVERFFQDRGAPVFHEVSPLADASLLDLLHARFYRPIEFTSVMYRSVGPDTAPVRPRDDRMCVRPIQPNEGVLWAQTTVRGWSDYPEFSGFLSELGSISTRREDAVSLLVELERQPIAAGAMSLSGGVALMAGACTVPEARRQGAQARRPASVARLPAALCR